MDQGLFLGLVSLPYRANYDENKKYFELLFSSYKENVASVSLNKKVSEDLFVPKFYHVFGHYDLAVFSLVDDFVFGQQKFKPFSETALCNKKEFSGVEFKNFSYQVHNCIVCHELPLADKILHNHPLALIGHFKIKSSLVLGAGEEAIQFVLFRIRHELKGYNSYCLLRTNSWQEIILIIFGSIPAEMAEHFLRVRELITTVRKSKILTSYVNEIYKGAETEPFPLFSFVHSYFGISYELDESERIRHAQDLKLYTNLFVRPGYLNQLKANVCENVIFGNGDLVIHNTDPHLLHATSDKNNTGNAAWSIRKTKSTSQINIPWNKTPGSRLQPGHCTPVHATDLIVQNIGLPQKDVIKCLDDVLCKLKVDKAIRSRVLKAIINYKDSIQDSALYSYFLDLFPFVYTTASYVNNLGEEYDKGTLQLPLETIHNRLNQLADVVEVAYRTRMQHSHRTLDMTDSTLEFSGGIHQIISAYDSVFKLLRKALGYYRGKFEEDYTAIASLSSRSGISSDKFSININYLYLSQPEFFIATIFKESLNGILDVRLGTLDMFPGMRAIGLNDVVDYNKGDYKARHNKHKDGFEQDDVGEQCHYQFLSLLSVNEAQVMAKTKKEIINQIQRLDISAHQKWEMWEFTLLINKDLFEYFTYDFYNYKFFFGESYENYLFWVWHLFFQERSNYEVDGLLKADNFLRLVFRTLFLIESIEVETDRAGAAAYFEAIMDSYKPSKALYRIKKNDFNIFFEFLFNRPEAMDKSGRNGCQIINNVFHLCFIRSFNKRQMDMGIKLMSYFVGNINEGPEKNHYHFLVSTIQQYLYELRVDFLPRSANPGRIGKGNLIYRNFQSGTIMRDKKGEINIKDGLYFDSGGGLFIVGDSRQKYFTRRNELMKELISWSNQFKLEMLRSPLKYKNFILNEK